MPMSHLQPNSSFAIAASEAAPPEYSKEERLLLLRLAHDSIASVFAGHAIASDPPAPHLAELRGVFTSLHLRGELRGCVGYFLPASSVHQAVAETARAAAFSDNRFPPVTRDEALHLEIELSILSAPQLIEAEAVEVGRHGLLISQHGRRGLLLPQVPGARKWDRITFLEQTCLKAGLPPDAWRKGASIQVFTAEIFSDQFS
jgi:AmmeMemoRadiSam system protein A